jgi:hypothetical protein
MINVTLSTDERTVFIGRFPKRRQAFRAAINAAGPRPDGRRPAFFEHACGFGFAGAAGKAWIVE